MSCGYLKLNCTRGVESEILLLHKFVAISQLVNLAVLKPYMGVGYFVCSSRLYVAQLSSISTHTGSSLVPRQSGNEATHAPQQAFRVKPAMTVASFTSSPH